MAGVEGAVTESVAPFLRWAGGKRWLLNKLSEVIGAFEVKGYHEPFLGGASMFFGLNPSGPSHLADLNAELIETYTQVRDHPVAVASLLDKYENRLDAYYRVRDERPRKALERAARFIFLNHTSFNGIYRVNLDGEYNVPFGNRESPNVPTEQDLLAVAARLAGSTLTVSDFESVTKRVRKGHLVFLDPPYTVAHNNNGFVKYNQKLFSFEDQRRLKCVIDKIKAKRAFYILTNAAHSSISELFDSDDRKLEITRRNSIGGKAADRGSATEFLFTNVPADA